MAKVIACGNKADRNGIALLKDIQTKGMHLFVFQSSTLHRQLLDEQVPHLHIQTLEQIDGLLSNGNKDIEMVIGFPPEDDKSTALWMENWHAFVRSAAMKFEEFITVIAPQAYDSIKQRVSKDGSLSFSTAEKVEFAEKTFRLLSELDGRMANELAARKTDRHSVLVVGGGGREHALAWKLAQSTRVSHVYVAPGNGGTSSEKISNIAIGVDAQDDLIAFSKEKNIGLCVVGPEAPLIAGLVNRMTAEGIPAFGPTKAAAELEASKAFSKDFMARHNIRTARFSSFTEYEKAKKYLDSIDYDVVVKASGIAAGKGVIIPRSKQEAHEALISIMLDKAFGSAGDEIVIEEFLTGEEVSVLAFCDGKTTVTMPGAQDHKRIFDADEGPNTGGMGAYAPAPCLTEELQVQTSRMVQEVVDAMASEGTPYVGILYAGFMLTKDGPSVLEFNCRFGDPETQVLLPLLSSDLFEVFLACVQGRLSPSHVQWKSGSAATIVMASQGYPSSYPKGKEITGVGIANSLSGVQVFHAGTKLDGSALKTSGGRVLAVSARGKDLRAAVDRAYQGVSKISFEGHQYRGDIALRGLLHGLSPIKLAVLGSTRGSSMQPIIDAIAKKELNAEIKVVVTNKPEAGIVERAKTHGIEVHGLSSKGKKREAFDDEVSTIIEGHDVDLVLLIGYMRILSGKFCQKWEGRVLNVHPSLLPDFAGGMDLAVHQAVIDAKKTETGCTTHFVTEEVDAGPIAVQMKCPVTPDDTAESLKARVQPLEGKAFLQSIRLFHAKKLSAKAQPSGTITYADAGVNITAGNTLVDMIKPLCKSTQRTGCDSDLGGFGGLFDLEAAGYSKDTVLVACTDGVGTKLKIAQLTNKHDTVGIDLVAMCVNDLIVQGAEPLLFLDYYACGSLQVDAAAEVVRGIAQGCRESGCGLIGGETAEMPSMYSNDEYDLAGFCVGAVQKHAMLPLPVLAGDILIGLPSSGVHSNGFSLVRKLIELNDLSYSDPCPYESPANQTLGESLLTPTRLYVKQTLPLLKGKLVNAIAHITGGGLLENIPRVLPSNLGVELNWSNWDVLPVFKWLQELGNISDHELSRTFNCGIGLVLILSPANEGQVMKLLGQENEKAVVMGKVVERSDDTVEQVKIVRN